MNVKLEKKIEKKVKMAFVEENMAKMAASSDLNTQSSKQCALYGLFVYELLIG